MNLFLILAAVLPAFILLIQVYRSDHLEKEPITMLLGLLLCGVIATELASLTEQGGDWLLGLFLRPGTRAYNILLYYVIVAVSEEGFKYLLLRWRTWKSPAFDCTFDGIVYAVFLSLGFALWENIHYVLHYGFATALARAVTAVPGHACFGVFMGTWYGAAKRWSLQHAEERSRVARWMSLLLPTLLHGVYDYVAITQMNDLGWLFLLFILVMFLASFRLVRFMSRKDTYMRRDL